MVQRQCPPHSPPAAAKNISASCPYSCCAALDYFTVARKRFRCSFDRVGVDRESPFAHCFVSVVVQRCGFAPRCSPCYGLCLVHMRSLFSLATLWSNSNLFNCYFASLNWHDSSCCSDRWIYDCDFVESCSSCLNVFLQRAVESRTSLLCDYLD